MLYISPKKMLETNVINDQSIISLYIKKENDNDLRNVTFNNLYKDIKKLAINCDHSNWTLKSLENFQENCIKVLEQNPNENLAIFSGRNSNYFTKLTNSPNNKFVIADSLHVKPILKDVLSFQNFYFSLIRKNKCILFLANPISCELKLKIELGDFHKDSTDDDLEKNTNKMISDFAQQVFSIAKNENTPLFVVSNKKANLETYLQKNKYPYLVESNWDVELINKPTEEIHKVIKSRLQKHNIEELREEIKNRSQKPFEGSLEETLELAKIGQIQKLFLSEEAEQWGTFDEFKNLIDYNPHQASTLDDDLYDDLAQIVIEQKGEVTLIPKNIFPEQKPFYLKLRW